MRCARGTRLAQGPFHIARHGKAPWMLRWISDHQAADLEGIVQRNKLGQFDFEPMPNIIELGVTLAVAGGVTANLLENRRGRRTPDLTIFQVLEIDRLVGLVGNRIVRPGIDLVLLAIAGPAETHTLRRNLKTKIAIGNDVDPRCGGLFPSRQGYDIFPAVLAETAHTIEELQIDCLTQRERCFIGAGLWTSPALAVFLSSGQRVQLLFQ